MTKPLEEYQRQLDALLEKKADHLKPPLTYTRGVVLPEDKRSRKRLWWLKIALRGLLILLLVIGFFAAMFIIAEVVSSLD
jgi:hypothetical protein